VVGYRDVDQFNGFLDTVDERFNRRNKWNLYKQIKHQQL
jgi:hypothetical protein